MSVRTADLPVYGVGREGRLGSLRMVLCVLLAGVVAAGAGLAVSRSGRAAPATHRSLALPAALVPVASLDIGASDPAFQPRRHGGSLVVSAGGIHAAFTRSGARLRADGGVLGMSLAAIGSAEHSLARVAPSSAGHRVAYRGGDVTTWYRGGPYGVEQGFTVSRRPSGAGATVVLRLATSGTLHARGGGSQLRFVSRSGRTVLRYGELSAVDATGRQLPASIELGRGEAIELRIDARGARYPLRTTRSSRSARSSRGTARPGTACSDRASRCRATATRR